MEPKWIANLRLHLKALETMNYPDGGMCSHFGVSVYQPGISAHINIVPKGNDTLITLYNRNRDQNTSLRTFQRWRKGVSSVAPILTVWNGKDGHNGISIVLRLTLPLGFVKAIDTSLGKYDHTKGDKSYEWFRQAYKAALKAQGVDVDVE